LYSTLETEGKNPLKDAHALLDLAVAKAYGCGAKEDPIKFLLGLKSKVLTAEKAEGYVQSPVCRNA